MTLAVRASPVVAVVLGVVSGTCLAAQFVAPPRADSTIQYLVHRLALRDTVGMVLPFDQTKLAAQGIARDSLLHMLLAGFDIGPIQEAKLIDRTEFHPFNATRVDEQLAYHVKGQQDNRLVFVAATTDSGRTWLTGLHWQQAPADLRQMNPFRLAGMSWLHYGFLMFAGLIPLFSLATAIVAAVSRIPYKWAWVVASLVSLGKLGIVWTTSVPATAAIRFAPLHVQLLGAGILKYPLYAPWVVSIGLPVFALGYWVVGRRRASGAPAPTPVAA